MEVHEHWFVLKGDRGHETVRWALPRGVGIRFQELISEIFGGPISFSPLGEEQQWASLHGRDPPVDQREVSPDGTPCRGDLRATEVRRLTEAERESRSAEAKEDGNEYGVQGDLRDLEHTLVPGWHCSSLCCGHSNPASSWIILADGCGCVYLPKAMRNGCADRYGLLLFGF